MHSLPYQVAIQHCLCSFVSLCIEVIVRDASTNALLCDLPKDDVLNCEVITANTLRLLTTGQTRFALQFEDENGLERATALLHQIGVQVERHAIDEVRCESPLPDLEDPAVQEYVLRLLFDEKFMSFASSMRSLLSRFRMSIPTSGDETPPQDFNDTASK